MSSAVFPSYMYIFEMTIKDWVVAESGKGLYLALSVEVGPFLQQERHGARLTIETGAHQGRPTFLQRVGGVRKTLTEA
jgi:hypothetical protein